MADPPEEAAPSFKEKCLFRITAFFILLATFSLFSFLFLVPFVIDPAFETIFMQFNPSPATCMTMSSRFGLGTSQCNWTSCREGCTKEIFNCTQILVNYVKNPIEWEEALGTPMPSPPPLPENRNLINWTFVGAEFRPNVKGCGYPPILVCADFFDLYNSVGNTFPCFYSRVDPEKVVSEYSIHKVTMDLVYTLAIPIPSFIISVVYLVFAYFKIYNEEPEAAGTTVPGDGEAGEGAEDGEADGEDADADPDGATKGDGDATGDGETKTVKFADAQEKNGPTNMHNSNSKGELGSPNGSNNADTAKYLQPGFLPEKSGKEILPPIYNNENILYVEVKEAGSAKSSESGADANADGDLSPSR